MEFNGQFMKTRGKPMEIIWVSAGTHGLAMIHYSGLQCGMAPQNFWAKEKKHRLLAKIFFFWPSYILGHHILCTRPVLYP